MKAPSFWDRSPHRRGILTFILSPLGWVYAAATRRRMKRTGYRSNVPVICVGNLNVGGTGKTPTTIFLAERLLRKSIKCHIVSKGYGGNIEGPVLVDPMAHKAEEVGDEPLLLSAFAPTWVSKNRAAGVRAAEEAGAEAILLDDGFQNPSVAKDLSIIVVDAAKGFGNGLCLPAGPLREPVEEGLSRADILLSIGPADAQADFSALWGSQISVPHIRGRLEPLKMGLDWSGQRVLAFAGIGNPEKFFATLRGEGADLAKTVALADHQPIPELLLNRLENEAMALGAQLVTTEKDQVRLPATHRHRVLALVVRLQIEQPDELDRRIDRLFSN